MEIVETAALLFEEVIVASVYNPQKLPLFELSERQAMLEECCAHLPNVRTRLFTKLVVDLAKEEQVDFIVKGLRAVSDFDNELQMAQMNQAISGFHTLFIPSASKHSFLASKLIRELARFRQRVDYMVPEPVAKKLNARYADE